MAVLYFVLYLLAGVFIGLAAAGKTFKPNPLALGLLFWVLVPLLQTLQKL